MLTREVHTCLRCRDSKRRCDKAKPKCGRCQRAGLPCHYNGLYTPSPDVEDSSSPSTESINSIRIEPAPKKIVKKRNRASLSCTRCHRLKVKCDKAQPCCSRCAQSGFGTTCEYTHRAQPTKQSSGPSCICKSEDDPQVIVATWFLRKRGSSHWKALLSRVESLSGLGDPPFQWLHMAVMEHTQGDCANDLALPGNFPFGTPESAQYIPSEKVKALLRDSRAEAPSYLHSYISLYQTSVPICDMDRLEIEIEEFWKVPESTNFSWLAQYLAVLGLGAFATDKNVKKSSEFFFASEACLAKTSYMIRPNILDIRTLCLLVVAKQVAYATCWALDSCWNVMGTVVRLALMMSLPLDFMPDWDAQCIMEERSHRRRLWSIIVYLDFQMALITGHTSPIPQDALRATYQPYEPRNRDDCWDSVLPSAMPLILHFLTRINSSTDLLTYDEVLEYDREVRQIMHRAAATTENNRILRITADIFFRRVLMVLHRRHAMDPDASTLFQTSYWSSLECSLALIIHHRELFYGHDLPHNVYLVGRPFMLDFFAAALTTCIHLLSTEAPLAPAVTAQGIIPPRQTILETLDSCLEIFAKEQNKSVCFSTGNRLLRTVYAFLPRE